MKYRVLDAVYCAGCEAPFKVRNPQVREAALVDAPSPCCKHHCAFLGVEPGENFSGDCAACFAREVVAAELVCEKCGAVFEVKDGIPIFINAGDERGSSENKLVRQTRDRFGFQWTHFRRTLEEDDNSYFLEATAAGDPEFFRGRVMLDAGCGNGRLIRFARKFGAREVFGFDFSRSVERAYREYADDPFVHILRCDIFNLPFRPGYFDYVYSLGVIHHTPDPAAAFARIARLVRADGHLSVWVYEDNGWRNYPTDFFWRKITTRLPQPVLYYLCHIAVPLGLVERWRFLRNPLLKAVGEFFWIFFRVSIKPNAADRVMATFDCYAPRYAFRIKADALKRWFEERGFAELRTTPAVGCFGRKTGGQLPKQ